MYLCIKQQVKHLTKEEYHILRELSHAAKNLYNESRYRIRQQFFHTGKYLPYEENYHLLKTSENYRLLNSNMAQQIMKEADGVFKSFFALHKKKSEGSYSAKVRIPHYLPKEGFTTLVIGFVRLKDDCFVIPYSVSYKKTHSPITIKRPPVLKGKRIKEIRIMPQSDARFFELQYTYEAEEKQLVLDKEKVLAIDPGVNNLAACVAEDGRCFLIDGRRLKSINRWYNKERARLVSIKDRQKYEGRTRRLDRLDQRRNNQVRDYIGKACHLIIRDCISH